eukprot:COSAG06_NODE_62654_length_264_cov_0.933333_1_plen_62_part_10
MSLCRHAAATRTIVHMYGTLPRRSAAAAATHDYASALVSLGSRVSTIATSLLQQFLDALSSN